MTRCEARNHLSVLILLSASAALCGCAGPGGQYGPPRAGAYDNVKATIDVRDPIEAVRLMADENADGTVTIKINKGSPTEHKLAIEKTDDGWVRTIEDYSVTHFRLTSDGAVVLTSEDDITEGVRMEYDPPLTILPAKLGGGEITRVESKVKVTDLKSGADRAHGTCSSTIVEIHQDQADTHIGLKDAYFVRQVRKLSLTAAEVSVVIDVGFVEHHGMFSAEVWVAQKTLGLFEKHTHTVMRRK